MTTHSSILAWRIPMDRGARWATVHGVAGSDITEAPQHANLIKKSLEVKSLSQPSQRLWSEEDMIMQECQTDGMWDFPEKPVIKTAHLKFRAHEYDPWWENYDPTCKVAWPKTKQTKKKR